MSEVPKGYLEFTYCIWRVQPGSKAGQEVMMTIGFGDLRRGVAIEVEGHPYEVVEYERQKMQQRRAQRWRTFRQRAQRVRPISMTRPVQSSAFPRRACGRRKLRSNAANLGQGPWCC